jgi:hypothetical protein
MLHNILSLFLLFATMASNNNEKKPYIRFPFGKLEKAMQHQVDALNKFLNDGTVNGSIIQVPHPKGGLFRATFYKGDEDDCFHYMREDGSKVEMFLMTPAYAGFVYRLTDY